MSRTSVKLNGIEVVLQDQPGKPLILLLRMASPDMGIWDGVWSGFAEHFTVASFDFTQLPVWRSDADYARIRAPTLILATELDRWNAGPSVAMAREVHRRIRQSHLEVLEGVGGHFLVEDPERLMRSVAAFLCDNSHMFHRLGSN